MCNTHKEVEDNTCSTMVMIIIIIMDDKQTRETLFLTDRPFQKYEALKIYSRLITCKNSEF